MAAWWRSRHQKIDYAKNSLFLFVLDGATLAEQQEFPKTICSQLKHISAKRNNYGRRHGFI
jgi:hypothetical protein